MSLPNVDRDRLAQIENEVKKRVAPSLAVRVDLLWCCCLSGEDLPGNFNGRKLDLYQFQRQLTRQYGLEDGYIGTPAVINSSGIQQVLEVNLTDEEAVKMQESARKMDEILLAAK